MILVPVVLISMLLVVQFGLAYYARQVVAGATQDGAAAGARRGSSGGAGAVLAGQLIASSAGHLLTSHSSSAATDARTVTVVSTGQVVKVLPFFPTITVHATAYVDDRGVHPATQRAMNPTGTQPSVGRCRGDDGVAGVEAALAVIALLAVMFFVVGALRVTNSAGDVDAAARAAARAAAAGTRTSARRRRRHRRSPTSALSSRGVACAGGPAVRVGGSVEPGGVVTVTVTCVVSLADASPRWIRRFADRHRSWCRSSRQCPRRSAPMSSTTSRRCRGDRGDLMAMTAIVIVFLMAGSWALISASQQWGARRSVQATAAAAAPPERRSPPTNYAPGSSTPTRRPPVPKPSSPRPAALARSTWHGDTVTVTATRRVGYSFPAPGFPAAVTGQSIANAVAGVRGDEGG